MSDETKPAYSPGLEGVIGREWAICWVAPNAGVVYRGYDMHELDWRASFEEVAWLLLHGELPTASELASLTGQLAEERALPPAVIEMLRLTPAAAHPMDLLRTGVSMLASFDPELNDHSHAANLRKAVRLIAKVSTLITLGWRIARGHEPLPAKADLTHAGNFLYQLSGEVPEMWRTRMFDTILGLYADHEFNASTFAARVTPSTMADIYAPVTSVLTALKGPLHGGANDGALNMLLAVGTTDRAEPWVMDRLARKEKIL